MSSLLKLNFPDSEFDYWYLYWLGNPYIKRKKMYVDIYFCNCRNADDKIRPMDGPEEEKLDNFAGIHFQISVLFSSIHLYALGSIFGRNGRIVVEPGQMPRQLVNITLKPSDKAIRISEFDDLAKILMGGHPLAQHFIIHDSKCFISRRLIGSKMFTVILPVTVFAQSFYFFSNSLTEILIFCRVSEIFSREDLILTTNEKWEKVLEIHYNNEIVTEDEIAFLSNLLAVDVERGYRALQFIGGNLLQELVTKKATGDLEPEALLDATLPMERAVVMDAMGKYFSDDIVLIYEIEVCNPYNNKPAFDRIEFVKKNPTYKGEDDEKDKTNKEPGGVRVISTLNPGRDVSPQDDKVNDDLSKQSRRMHVRGIFDFPNLQKDVLADEAVSERLNEKGKVVPLSGGDGLSTGGESDKDFDKAYVNFCQEFTIINREAYIETLVSELQDRNIDCRFIFLSARVGNSNTFLKVYHGRLRSLMIVELNYFDRLFYLIEFPTGMTGLLSKADFRALDPMELDRFINKYFHFQQLVYSNNKDLLHQFFPNGQYYVRKQLRSSEMGRFFMDDLSIAVYPFIEHQEKNMKNTEHLIEHTCSKILNRFQKATGLKPS